MSLRYADGGASEHGHVASVRDRLLGVSFHHVHDLRGDTLVVPRDVRLAARELGVPHEEKQANVRREDVEVGVREGRRRGGARGDQTDRRYGGLRQHRSSAEKIVEGDVRQACESPCISHRGDRHERVDSNRRDTVARLSVVHIRGGWFRGLDEH